MSKYDCEFLDPVDRFHGYNEINSTPVMAP